MILYYYCIIANIFTKFEYVIRETMMGEGGGEEERGPVS